MTFIKTFLRGLWRRTLNFTQITAEYIIFVYLQLHSYIFECLRIVRYSLMNRNFLIKVILWVKYLFPLCGLPHKSFVWKVTNMPTNLEYMWSLLLNRLQEKT
jgi:hypothetical protein